MSATLSPASTNTLDIDSPYTVTPEQIAYFREQGYIKLKQVLSPEVLAHYGRQISRKVQELNTNTLPMEQRDTYRKAFLQVGNIWTHCAIVKEFVFGKRLARLAAELMGTTGVRMYHDQALYKEASGGHTPWHADQHYWPLATSNCCTAWIPLQAVPMEMGPLSFAKKSHSFKMGRELSISDESERALAKMLRERNFEVDETPFDLGEVSFHYGWTFHRAGNNTTPRPREVMTIIYMDEDMRVAKPENQSQEGDRKGICPDLAFGEIIDTPLTPVMYSNR